MNWKREREIETTHTHHGKNPLMTRLSIKANNSSKRVVNDGIDKPNMVHEEHQQTQRHQNKIKLLLLHAANSTCSGTRNLELKRFLIMNDSLVYPTCLVINRNLKDESTHNHLITKLIYSHQTKRMKVKSNSLSFSGHGWIWIKHIRSNVI